MLQKYSLINNGQLIIREGEKSTLRDRRLSDINVNMYAHTLTHIYIVVIY
jgi:hypothetical protein